METHSIGSPRQAVHANTTILNISRLPRLGRERTILPTRAKESSSSGSRPDSSYPLLSGWAFMIMCRADLKLSDCTLSYSLSWFRLPSKTVVPVPISASIPRWTIAKRTDRSTPTPRLFRPSRTYSWCELVRSHLIRQQSGSQLSKLTRRLLRSNHEDQAEFTDLIRNDHPAVGRFL